MRRVLIVLVAVVVVVVVAALVVPTFIDWNVYKTDLAERVQAATGRILAIDGDISVRLLPTPELSASDARLSNIDGADAAEMVSIAAVEIRVAFLPLLGGDIQVERIGLVEPVVTLERLADGRSNWVFEPLDEPSEDAAAETAAADTPAEADDSTSGLSLDTLQIENGVVTFRDAASDTVARLEQLNARLSAGSLAGPFASRGDVLAGGVAIAFDISAGDASGGQALPLVIDITLTDAGTNVRLEGRASELSAAADVNGQLSVSVDNAASLGAALETILGSEAPPLPDEPFSLRTRIAASAEETALNEMLITLGETRASGAVSAAYGEGLQIDVALNLNRLDLDRLLNEDETGPGSPAAPAEDADLPLADTSSGGAFALPEDFSGSFNLQVEALTYNAAIVRQLSVSASALNGVVDVSRAAALLPGGSDITASGMITAGEEGPEFEGRVEAASDNLRALLTWLAVDTSAIPADRLRKALVGADIGVTPTAARISGIDLRVDSSRLTGEGSFALGERPDVSANLTVDRFNADAYLPAANTDAATAPSDASAGEETASDDAALAGADTFDADLRLRIDEFTFNDTAATGLSIDANLTDGILELRDASIEDIGGGYVRINGRARDLSQAPVFSGDIEIAADNPSALFRFAEIETPAPAARLSPLRLAGTFEAEAEAVGVDIEGSAADTKVRIRGSVGTAAGEAPMSLAVELTNQSLAALIGQVAAEPIAGIDRAVALTGTIAGPMQKLDVALHADLAGAKISIAGDVTPATPNRIRACARDRTRRCGGVLVGYRGRLSTRRHQPRWDRGQGKDRGRRQRVGGFRDRRQFGAGRGHRRAGNGAWRGTAADFGESPHQRDYRRSIPSGSGKWVRGCSRGRGVRAGR